jgi:hypothetical protein
MARRKKSVEPSIDDRIREAEAVVERLKREKQDSMVWVGQLPHGAEGQSLEQAVENAEMLLRDLKGMQADGLTVRKYATGRNDTGVCVVTIDPAVAEKRKMVAVAEWAGDPKSSKHSRKWFVD